MTLADRASSRTFSDLVDATDRQRSILGTEPLMDLMELSGYALFMSELDGSGIWSAVRTLWEARLALDTGPALADYLVRIATFQANTFSLTTGAVGRTNRRMTLARLLGSRGIRQVEPMWGVHEDPPHPNPVIAEFAPSDMGLDHDLSDLFLVEFLFDQPAAFGFTMPSSAPAMLRRALDDRRGVEDDPEDDGS